MKFLSRLPINTRLALCACAVVFYFGLSPALAETPSFLEESDLPDLAPEIPVLPDPTQPNFRTLVIDRNNALKFKSIIVPELYPDLRSGAIAMESARKLKFTWRYDDAWERTVIDGKSGALNADGSLKEGVNFSQGMLFGNAGYIAKESDPVTLAKKILWNLTAQFARLKIIDIDFALTWLKEAQAGQEINFSFSRVYPKALNVNDKTDQIFREKLSVRSPAVINSLRWLSFRFLGADEDALWIYSPAIRKTRQLTGSNRSDSILKSGLSLDDLLVWSGKIQSADPIVESSVVALVPFGRLDMLTLGEPRAGCQTVLADLGNIGAESRAATWNYESRRFPEGAGWLPTNVIYVPRNLWRLEINSKDPYGRYGREVLYVDKAMMLPVYKIVYDREGRRWKTVIAVFDLAITKERTTKVPVNSLLVINDQLNSESYLVDYKKIRYCSEYPDGTSLADFDPGKIAPKDPSAVADPSVTAEPTATVEQGEEDTGND